MLSYSSPPRSNPFEWHSGSIPKTRRTSCSGSSYSTEAVMSPLTGRLFHQPLTNSDKGRLLRQPLEHISVTSAPLGESKPEDSEQSTQTIVNKTRFAFERHARSSSPVVRLGAHVKDNRESRRTSFIDGIRVRRQRQMDERLGDQILRMDYLRELKAWEQQKAMEEMVEQNEPDDEDLDMAEEPAPEYEREIEQLVSCLEDEQDLSDCFSDDGYDQLFMELSMSPEEVDHDML